MENLFKKYGWGNNDEQPTVLYGGINNNNYVNTDTNKSGGGRNFGSLLGMGKSGLNAYQGFSSGGSTPWGAISGLAKNGYNFITDKTPDDYSDFEQTMIYPLQGAATGASFGGPWGALGGALYGLGYSFKDDVGLDDDNFFTKLLFPIGMGDGGGFIDLG